MSIWCGVALVGAAILMALAWSILKVTSDSDDDMNRE